MVKKSGMLTGARVYLCYQRIPRISQSRWLSPYPLARRRLFPGVRHGLGWLTIMLAGGSISQLMDCSEPLPMGCHCRHRTLMLWGGGDVSGCVETTRGMV